MVTSIGRRRACIGLSVALAAGLAILGWRAAKGDDIADASALLSSGLDAHAAGDFRTAVEFFDRVIAIAPDSVPALHARASARYGVDQLDEAVIDYQRILEVAPQDAEARFRLAKAFLGQRREKEMFEQLDALLAIAPQHCEGRLLRAWVHFNRREHQQALADLDLLVGDASMRGSTPLLEILPVRAEARLSIGDDAGALEDLDQLRRLGGDEESVRRTTVWAFWGMQRYGEALQLLEQLEDDFGPNVNTRLARGLTQMHMGRDDEALAALVAIRQSGVTPPPEADLFLWVAQMRRGDAEAAARDLPPAEAFTRWHALIGDFLRGTESERDLLEVAGREGGSATPRQRQCEAFYYAGMKRLFAGDRAGARTLLQQCVATGERRYYEHHAAVAELQRMEFIDPDGD